MAEVTRQLVDMIENAEHGNWQKPWQNLGRSLAPFNAVSKHRYTGGNRFGLAFTTMDKGYSSSEWATYKQWESIGAQVRKGETSEYILAPRPYTRTVEKADGSEEERSGLSWRVFSVFNADQVDGYEPKARDIEPLAEHERVEDAEAWIWHLQGVGRLDLRHNGDRAYYAPVADYVQMPTFDQFHTGEGYYSTLFHELTHWTAHQSRLDRKHGERWGSSQERYAAEELVAELGAAFLCADFGFSAEPRPDHAAYLASWLGALKNDPQLLWTAASQAEKAVKYLNEAGAPVPTDNIKEA